MTLHATATTSPARDAANPALMAALAVTALAAGTIAGAWYFQLVLDIRPCPLCLEQRKIVPDFVDRHGIPRSIP